MNRRKSHPFNGYDPSATTRTPQSAPVRCCEWPGCGAEAPYRAPWSPSELNRHRWFCLAHVRLYNESWNYYAGMSEPEIEADLRNDTIGRRPTWPLGSWGAMHRFKTIPPLHDPFHVSGGDASGRDERRNALRPRTPEEDALVILELKAPVTLMIVKARYKQLVKKHHPDANGGDKGSEERFKLISQAYRTIVASLSP